MLSETRYQRVAREQCERKAAREAAAIKRDKEIKASARKLRRQSKDAAAERRYVDVLTSDHDHSMNS